MLETTQNLGKLESVHGIAPAYLQRAAVIAILSFIFFAAMLFGFYIRQAVGYFLLSTAFLIVYIFMMFDLVTQRRNVLKIYEDGFTYKNFFSRWSELDSIELRVESRLVSLDKINCEISKINGEKVVLTESVQNVDKIIERIDEEIDKRSEGTVSEDDEDDYEETG
jgi:hypothetical protein